jgi:hypothetical protein
MRNGWLLLALVSGLLTVLIGISVILDVITLRLSAITAGLVFAGLFLLTRWAWRKARDKE